MSDIRSHLIHDEAKSSTELDVSRELSITSTEFSRKIELMDRMCMSHVKGDFVSCELVSKKRDEANYVMWTRHKACMNIQLSSKYGSKYYFGTRSSPTRILTGQNVVEVSDIKRVDKVASKLKCTQFEARTVLMFSMIRRTVRLTLGFELFTASEIMDIRDRKLNVGTVGFASYLDFGPRRDELLHLLSYLGSSQIEMGGDAFPLVSMLGAIGCKTWRRVGTRSQMVNESIALGPNQGVLFSKQSSAGPLVSQMMYLKDYEIEAKANQWNSEAASELGTEDTNLFPNLVRVDTVFHKEYLKRWTKQWSGLELGSDLELRAVASLLDNKNNVQIMCRVGSNELGIRLLLTAPTMKMIDELDAEPRVLNLISIWKAESRISIKVNKGGKVLTWPDVIGTNSVRRRIAEQINAEHHLDLTVPYDFYRYLNRARFLYFVSPELNLALSAETMGEVDSEAKALDLKSEKKSIRAEVNSMLADLRSRTDLTTTVDKSRALAQNCL